MSKLSRCKAYGFVVTISPDTSFPTDLCYQMAIMLFALLVRTTLGDVSEISTS